MVGDLRDHRTTGQFRLEGILMIIQCQPLPWRGLPTVPRLPRVEAGQGPIGAVVPHVGTDCLHPAREIQRDVGGKIRPGYFLKLVL